MKKYIIQDREAGNIISTFLTMSDAQTALNEYENSDKKDGIYVPDFYEIKEMIQPIPKTMNKNKTTKSKAIIWWTEQIRKGTAQKYRDFYHNGDMLLDNEQIEQVYLSEHPQTEEQVKEVDILDNKLVKWVEDGCPPIDLNKYPSLVVKLASENKRLKEVNKLLVDALDGALVGYIACGKLLTGASQQSLETTPIISKGKTALKEANLIK